VLPGRLESDRQPFVIMKDRESLRLRPVEQMDIGSIAMIPLSCCSLLDGRRRLD
jgi:hypothetical protein